MSIQEIANLLIDAGIEKNEANAEVKLLLEHFCNFKTIDILFGKKLDTSKLNLVREKVLERIRTGNPVQYIIGFADFMGEKFIVNKNVLIPRDETEILVTKAIEIALKTNSKKILDIGTGSGCIACSIAKAINGNILGVDISKEALEVANQNAKKLILDKRVSFKESDLFSNLNGEKFDIIVSNPPYIPPQEKAHIQKEVLKEPDLALYTKDDKGLEFYEKIIQNAPKHLNSKGYILFELGIGQSEDVKNLLVQNGFKNIEIEKDLANIDRVIFAQI